MMQALVQVRGEIDMSGEVQDTLSMLNLHRVNHCAFVPETDTYRGMITKVNDFVAYGEPSQAVVEELLRRRAEPGEDVDGTTTGTERTGGSVDDEWVGENTDYDDIASLAAALIDEETTLREQGLTPALRLHPPRGGHDGIKHPVAEGGELGKHTTEEIDALLRSMR